MKVRNIQFTGLLIALLLAFTIPAVAQQAGPKCTKGKGQNICQRLPNLTEQQTTDIAKLRTEHLNAMNNFRAEIAILKAEQKKLEIAENVDQKAIESKIDELFAVKIAMAKHKSEHRQKVRALLTDEQKAIFDAHAVDCRGKSKGAKSGNRAACPNTMNKGKK